MQTEGINVKSEHARAYLRAFACTQIHSMPTQVNLAVSFKSQVRKRKGDILFFGWDRLSRKETTNLKCFLFLVKVGENFGVFSSKEYTDNHISVQ